jgi:hypothetical protein
MQVDRLHELKPQLRKARADSQIATTLAVCELVFIALLNENRSVFRRLVLAYSKLGPEKSQAVHQPSS